MSHRAIEQLAEIIAIHQADGQRDIACLESCIADGLNLFRRQAAVLAKLTISELTLGGNHYMWDGEITNGVHGGTIGSLLKRGLIRESTVSGHRRFELCHMNRREQGKD